MLNKVVQTWFVLDENWHSVLFGIYYCVKMVRIENNSRMLEITCYVSFLRFFKHLLTFSHKVVQTWFVFYETWHTRVIGIYFWVELI